MGQAETSPGEKTWCCSCSGKPSSIDAPIQVIHEPLSSNNRSAKVEGAEVAQPAVSARVLAYSPKGSPPPNQQKSQSPGDVSTDIDQTTVPEPAPEDGLGLEPVPVPEQGQAPRSRSDSADPFATLETLPAEPFATLDYEEMTKKQKVSAKQLVKDFVKTMVRGRQLVAVLPSGQVRACFCALNRGLDKLQIRANERDRHGRTVPLATIAEIVVGSDKSASAGTEGLETPLDDLSITLVLDTDECITFRLEDLESRDKLAACLTMFSGQARAAGRA